jgi:hypothetical protein
VLFLYGLSGVELVLEVIPMSVVWQDSIKTEPVGDTIFFQQALKEFRQAENIQEQFHLLPVWAQSRILSRAQCLKRQQ